MDNMIYIATSILAMRCENYTPSCSHACLKRIHSICHRGAHGVRTGNCERE